MKLKIILQVIAVIFLAQGTYTAFFKKNDYFVENGTPDNWENIKKARRTIFVVNLLIWGSALILIQYFL